MLFAAVLAAQVLEDDGAVYRCQGLTAAEQTVAEGWASYARAKYLLDSRSPDFESIAAHLVRCLMALPEAKTPFRLLVYIRGSRKDIAGLASDLGKVAKVQPDNAFINLAYSEALRDSGQKEAGVAHLRAFQDRTSWQDVSATIALLEIMQADAAPAEAEKLLQQVLRRKNMRKNLRLQLYRAEFILRAAARQVEKLPSEEQARHLASAKKQSLSIVQKVLADPACRTQGEIFTSLLPSLHKLALWEELNHLLDNWAEEFQDTQFWYEQKLLVLQKLQKSSELQLLAEQLRALPELPNDLLERLALAYQELQDYARAREIYEGLHFRNLPILRYRLQLAWLYLVEDKPKMGLAILTPVRELPFRGYLLQAALWRAMHEPEKALQSYAQAEKTAIAGQQSVELDDSFYTSYATVAESMGKIDLSLELFRKAYQLNPESPNVCNGLGYTLADYQRELSFAAELIDKAVQAEPKNVAFLDSLAWVRFRQGDASGALEAMILTLQYLQPGFDSDGIISKHAAEIFAANGLQIMADFFQQQSKWNVQD